MKTGGVILKKNIRQKHIWLIALYGIFYLIGFRILEKNITKGYHEIHMPLDDTIPFCEFFIIPYFFWFFYIAVTVIYFTFFQEEVREYYQLMISLAIGMTLFLIISWLYPIVRRTMSISGKYARKEHPLTITHKKIST